MVWDFGSFGAVIDCKMSKVLEFSNLKFSKAL